MNRRHHIHLPRGLGEKAADVVTAFAGSWTFVGIHAVWFVAWIALGVEPYPFGLLTMIVSLEAIFLSTLVMLSQNRQAQRDRLRDDTQADEVEQMFRMQVELDTMNKRQLEILEVLRKVAPVGKFETWP